MKKDNLKYILFTIILLFLFTSLFLLIKNNNNYQKYLSKEIAETNLNLLYSIKDTKLVLDSVISSEKITMNQINQLKDKFLEVSLLSEKTNNYIIFFKKKNTNPKENYTQLVSNSIYFYFNNIIRNSGITLNESNLNKEIKVDTTTMEELKFINDIAEQWYSSVCKNLNYNQDKDITESYRNELFANSLKMDYWVNIYIDFSSISKLQDYYTINEFSIKK